MAGMIHKNQYDITCARWGEVSAAARYDMAILPWGATEPHNYHLPYGTDMLTATAVSLEVAAGASEQGVKAMVLPGIPLGSQNPGQVELPYCLHASQQTQFAILRDILCSLKRQGIYKLLVVNGHGGNNFKGFIRDLTLEMPEFTIACCEWFSIVPRDGYFEAKEDDHAGELETSVMLHYYPELVDMSVAGDGNFKRYAIEGLNEKVAWIPRNWGKISADTGVGSPVKATAAKGKRYMEAVIPRITALVVDLVTKEIY